MFEDITKQNELPIVTSNARKKVITALGYLHPSRNMRKN